MVYNTRSPEQWRIISEHIDFQGKTVLDLGCGKGDILAFAAEAGAHVTGIDSDKANIEYVRITYPEIEVIEQTVNFLEAAPKTDIIICFSVLPYLVEPLFFVLQWINRHSEVAFIECQYAGDGPGFEFLTDNDDMEKWLFSAAQFEKVEAIGHTLVEGRNTKRYIWMCE